MFQTDTSIVPEKMAVAVAEANANYNVQENDYLEVKVYTNGGEMIIDPNNEIMKEMNAGTGNQQVREKPQFLVRKGGTVRLPLIGDVPVAGLTLHELDSLLQKEYSAYYEDVFVITKYVNKRVVVLGATGGQVIPLQNEDMNLLEVLALAGGTSPQDRVDNIRLIRGELQDPEVRIINLSTIEGMKQSSMKVLPGDIIYVEPVQRVTSEAIRDITPILGFVTSIITLGLLISRL